MKNRKHLLTSPITLIGATNLNTKNLDVFRYDKLSKDEQIDILMATTAIPILFSPKKIKGDLYVDGGTIENEIIYQVLDEYQADYYNFTFISSTNRNNIRKEIDTIFKYIKSVSSLLVNNYIYNIAKIKNNYFDCHKGKINIYYPTDNELLNYSYLDFNNGEKLIELAKNNYEVETINFC